MAGLRGLIDYSDPNSLGSRLRAKRFALIEAMVETVLAEKERCALIDVGGAAAYWRTLRSDLIARCDLTIVNVEGTPGPDPYADAPDGAKIDVQVADGRDLRAFGDGAFDIAHSNSVIEHVGLYADMQRFAAETMRVGRRYYLQTPYYWFPVEPHFGAAFIHWLPTPLRLKLVRRFAFAFGERQRETADAMQAIEYCNLIDKAMATSLFPEADVRFERLLLLPKSIIVTGGGPARQSD